MQIYDLKRKQDAKKKEKKKRQKETELNRRNFPKIIAGDVDVNHKSLLHETSASAVVEWVPKVKGSTRKKVPL